LILADGNDWETTNLTVARNGSTIEGLAENLILDISSIQVQLIYDGTTWEVYAFAGAGGAGGATISATAPTSPSEGELWWDTDAGKLFIYYIDGDTSQWVEASPSQNPFTYDTQTDTYSTSSSISAKDFNSTSDQRLKENIQDLTVDYDILNSIRSVSFDWKDTGNSAYGFIAQELEDVLPELVATNSDTSYKSVSYTQLIPHLLEAIKDLKNQVDELKEKI